MRNLILAAMFFAVIATDALAQRMYSPEELELIKKEANPSADEVDLEKYNKLKESCIKEAIKNTGIEYEQYIQIPPPSDSVIPTCNKSAYENSRKEQE